MNRRTAKVICTFPYNGEPIVELQLEYLKDVVDEFVIVESRYTNSGIAKPELYFDKFHSVFANSTAKITQLVIDEFPEMPSDWPKTKGQEYMNGSSYDSWYRENYQRDYAANYIKDTYNNETSPYIVIGVDADEIMCKEYITELAKNYFALNDPVYLQMDMFYYNFQWSKKYKWYHPYVVNDIGFCKYTMSDMRTRMPKTKYMKEAGWHASYFLSKKDLIRKLEGFAHRECDIKHRKTDEFLNKCLYEGLDISERGDEEQLVSYSGYSQLPEELLKFQKKLMFLQRYSTM